MSLFHRALSALWLVTLIIGCDSTPSPEPQERTITPIVQNLSGALLSAWSTPDEQMLWFVGGKANESALIAQYDGTRITIHTTIPGPPLWWIWGRTITVNSTRHLDESEDHGGMNNSGTADHPLGGMMYIPMNHTGGGTSTEGSTPTSNQMGNYEAWACGAQGRIFHFNGKEWTLEQVELPEDLLDKSILWGIWGNDEGVWAVGGSDRRGGPKGLLLERGSDHIWRRVSSELLPMENPDDPIQGYNLFKIWGNDTHRWLIGEGGFALEWDGARFSPSSLPDPAKDLLFTLHGDQQGPWAVGGYSQGVVWKRSKETWTAIDIERVPPLNGVTVRPTEVVAVGQQGSLLFIQRAQTSDAQINDKSPYHLQRINGLETITLHAITQHQGSLWSVGGDLSDMTKGAIVSDHQSMPIVEAW